MGRGCYASAAGWNASRQGPADDSALLGRGVPIERCRLGALVQDLRCVRGAWREHLFARQETVLPDRCSSRSLTDQSFSAVSASVAQGRTPSSPLWSLGTDLAMSQSSQ